MFQRIINLREKTNLKILLGLGGWNHASQTYSDMVLNQTLRYKFIQTTIQFLKKHQFDGLDLDWVKFTSCYYYIYTYFYFIF